jgi:hypothetical protein
MGKLTLALLIFCFMAAIQFDAISARYYYYDYDYEMVSFSESKVYTDLVHLKLKLITILIIIFAQPGGPGVCSITSCRVVPCCPLNDLVCHAHSKRCLPYVRWQGWRWKTNTTIDFFRFASMFHSQSLESFIVKNV